MVQNEIYDKFLTKTETDIIFNKVKSIHKCKKYFIIKFNLKYFLKLLAICFEDFLMILIEFSKIVYPWEQNYMKSLSYFVNKYTLNIQCLKKTPEENIMERWYSFLENDEFSAEVKKHLSNFYKTFKKYKVKDLKVSECINITEFLKMGKDLNLIPVFLSTKDVINVSDYFKK